MKEVLEKLKCSGSSITTEIIPYWLRFGDYLVKS